MFAEDSSSMLTPAQLKGIKKRSSKDDKVKVMSRFLAILNLIILSFQTKKADRKKPVIVPNVAPTQKSLTL